MIPFVLFHHDVVQKFHEISTTCRDKNEIGGILIGSKRKEHIEITTQSYPGLKDESSLNHFLKKDPLHGAFAKLQWRLFKGTRTYFGEWHTHPSGHPQPSNIDLKTWADVTTKQKTNMVFVIISPSGWIPYLTLINNEKLTTIPLQKIEDGEVGVIYGQIKKEG